MILHKSVGKKEESKQAKLVSRRNGLHPVVNVQFTVNILDMVPERIFGDDQLGSNISIT